MSIGPLDRGSPQQFVESQLRDLNQIKNSKIHDFIESTLSSWKGRSVQKSDIDSVISDVSLLVDEALAKSEFSTDQAMSAKIIIKSLQKSKEGSSVILGSQAIISSGGAASSRSEEQTLSSKIESGSISYSEFISAKSSYPELLGALLEKAPKNTDGNPEITLTDVPDRKKGNSGVLKLVVKKDPITDDKGGVLSQLVDPVYREELLKTKDQTHYNFEFFDLGRTAEIDEKRAKLNDEEDLLNSVTNLFIEYSDDIDEFNKQFTPEQRKYYNIPEDKQLEWTDFTNLFNEHKDRLFLFPAKKMNAEEEFKKPTIRGRFSEDGSIGELKSVNIHSSDLGGTELMNVWDQFCTTMGVGMAYLEDDAKFEGKSGSYNMRLFRLMTSSKTSWYQDGHAYHPYTKTVDRVSDVEKAAEQAITRIQPFKEMKLSAAHALLSSPGFEEASETLRILEEYRDDDDDLTLGQLVSSLGSRVRKGEDLYKEIDLILETISTVSKYNGSDARMNELKDLALSITSERFYRKNYSKV